MISIDSVKKEGNKIKVIICKGIFNEIKYFDSEKEFKNYIKYNKIKWN